MIMRRLMKLVLFSSTIYLVKELGVWDEPIKPTSSKLGIEAEEPLKTKNSNDKPQEGTDIGTTISKELLKKKEDLEKKFCPKGTFCEPPPKPLGETIGEAFSKTWVALKGIPSYWSATFEKVGVRICQFFRGDK
ncbi:uncharacterized protein LOC26526475 [Drosophila erecta]|uniref:MICOS complex subunit MIC13 n=1 Tax=Drosophila erecta TaxID=7220 RepID=A0A0Q5VMT9_DROER|nr:uncharacterized protein LOC26526475 [Drosophila erecta]KQS62388.1 uncharacterized protein Dere_GG26651 [Drosophila erecta]